MSRPENQLPPQFFYNETESRKYTQSSRIIEIQAQMSERAVELLNMDGQEGSLILDIGCGSGLSGEILSENGFLWLGLDISRDMLNVARERDCEGDLLQIDMGQGFRFRPGVFDGAISVSALQWLCVASQRDQNPYKRLGAFFQSLYTSLRQNARAVLQFYPDGTEQIDMITKAAMKAGFSGGLVVDYPNSAKAKKMYLVLDAGFTGEQNIVMIEGKTQEEDEAEGQESKAKFSMSDKTKKIKKNQRPILKKGGQERLKKKSKKWIVQKKERMRSQGKTVKSDSKYTGRKRSLMRLLR